MANKINIEQLEEYLIQVGLDNGELENLLNPIKELNNQRRYGLVWEEPDNNTYGTDSAEQELLRNFPFLKEVNEHRIFNGEEHPDHLLIEGDNLHALKTMQYTHKNKIDVIYIDPPYNTGNTDFVYNDKFVDGEDSWRHSKWLSFMNKRLRLARELMTDEGVIFISIDDNEQAQLKLLCDQVFGESNFTGQLIRRVIEGGKSNSDDLLKQHEYVLVYKKTSKGNINKRVQTDFEHYNLEDEYVKTRGKYYLKPLFTKGLGYVASLDYGIPYGNLEILPNKNGDKVYRWIWKKERVINAIENGFIVFNKNKKGEIKVYYKTYQYVDTQGNKIERALPYSTYVRDGVGNRQAMNELNEIFGNKVFDTPKPTGLVKEFIAMGGRKDSIILDFFAGSGTTSHAVMELNKEDGGNRKSILVTNNEINSSDEEDLLVEKGYVEPFTCSRRGTKKHAKWLEKVNEFKQTPEYLEFIKTDEYKDLGIARAVTEQRINKVINGYTTPRGKEVEGLDNNNFYHFEVVLEPDLLDMDLNTYVLVNKTKDIIRIKEGVYTKEEDISTETVPSVKLTDKDKEVIVVLSVRVTDSDIEELVNNFKYSEKEHVIYTSYTGFEYGINNIRFEELPKELLQAIKHEEGK